MSRHQFTGGSAKNAGDFAPFFDWGEKDEPVVSPMPPENIAERIADACRAHLAGGGLIVRCAFGVETVDRKRDARGRLSGVYEVKKHCCPLAPLLAGLPSRFNPVADFAAVLGVDHLWVLGFIHGFDKTELFTGRRAEQFNESLSYVDGHAAGVKVASQFYVVDLGWEV